MGKLINWKMIGERVGKLDGKEKGQFFQGYSCAMAKKDDGTADLESLARKIAKLNPAEKARFFNAFAECSYDWFNADIEIEFLLTGMKINSRHKNTLKRAFTCLWIRGE